MPLPFLVGAAIAGAAGVGSGINGAVKMHDAKETIEAANARHKKNLAKQDEHSKAAALDMDNLGKLELQILNDFDEFSNVWEKIQNKPEFKKPKKNGVEIPTCSIKELKDVSIGAGVLLAGLGGAAIGTAGGIAASGATTAAIMAFGTASTGTAIATLSGAAATNAVLAALGGGAIAAGGGGVALGTTVLGAATLGVGLLVGGVIFNFTGSKLSENADEAWNQMQRAEREIERICAYCKELSCAAVDYFTQLKKVNYIYSYHLDKLRDIVETEGKTNFRDFTREEQLVAENTTLLVGLLYNMCKVELELKPENEGELCAVNYIEIEKSYKAVISTVESLAR